MAQEQEIQDDSDRTWNALRDAERRLQRRLDHSTVRTVFFHHRPRRAMEVVVVGRVKDGKVCGRMPNRQVVTNLYAAAKAVDDRRNEHYAALDSYHEQWRDKRRRAMKEQDKKGKAR